MISDPQATKTDAGARERAASPIVSHEPGETMRQVLSEMPEFRKAEMLAYYEQRAIREGDLEVLREVRAYQRSNSRP